MDTRKSLLSGLLLVAATALAQAPSVPGTGSNAGKTPALAAPAASGPSTAPAGTTPPSVPASPGNLLPPMNATGLVPPAVPAPAAVNGVVTRADTAPTAFRALDPGNRGYVTRADTDRVPGFVGFDNADTDRNGQLTAEEFANAWKFYSGR